MKQQLPDAARAEKDAIPTKQGLGLGRAALPAAVPGAGKQRSARAVGCFGGEEGGVCCLLSRNSEMGNMNGYGSFGVPWQHFRHTSPALVFV